MIVELVADLDLRVVGEPLCVMSGLPALVGLVGSNRCQDDRGRLCGCGVTNPRSLRIRQIVDTPGAWPSSCSRWNAIVAAPASCPALSSVLRISKIRSSVALGVRRGLECGRRERGSRATSPSSAVAADQDVHPLPRHAVFAGDLALRAAFQDDGTDNEPSQRRLSTPTIEGVNDVPRHLSTMS